MELTALLTRGQTSFSHTKDTAIPYSVLEEIKKAAPVKMCKVQISFRQFRTDRPIAQLITQSTGEPPNYLIYTCYEAIESRSNSTSVRWKHLASQARAPYLLLGRVADRGLLWPHNQHRKAGGVHDALGHTSHRPVGQATATMRCHRHDITPRKTFALPQAIAGLCQVGQGVRHVLPHYHRCAHRQMDLCLLCLLLQAVLDGGEIVLPGLRSCLHFVRCRQVWRQEGNDTYQVQPSRFRSREGLSQCQGRGQCLFSEAGAIKGHLDAYLLRQGVRQGDHLIDCRAQEKQRDRTLACNSQRDAPRCPALESGLAVTAHDDQIRLPRLRFSEDAVCGISFCDHLYHVETRKHLCRCNLLYIRVGMSLFLLISLRHILQWPDGSPGQVFRRRDRPQQGKRRPRCMRHPCCDWEGQFRRGRSIQRNKQLVKHGDDSFHCAILFGFYMLAHRML